VPKVGVIGSLVWDLIHGRDPLAPPTEEWGGIAYALGGLDASLPPDWQIVPLIKVGRDLAPEAAELLKGLARLEPGARCVEVPAPNNRVVLHYQSAERRCERMSGGVPGWTWLELGPMVMDLDAIYLNFISGFELTLGTAQALRQGFPGPIYADLHSLFLGMHHDGIRVLQPLADPAAWFGCFDAVQLNEDEMRQLSPDPLSLSAQADCTYPKAPASIPNGATASEQEMLGAMQAFKAYDADVKSFGACLDQETKEKSAGTAQLMQLKTMQSKKLNAAVDELQAKAKEFNEQVRAFKARG